MAISAVSSFASWDPASGTYKLDVSQILAEILKYDVSSLSLFGSAPAAKATKSEWIESDLNTHIINSAASGTGSALTNSNADVDLLFLAGDYPKVRVGAVLKDQAAGKTEQIMVTALDGDSVATVLREHAGTTAEAHAASAVWTIVSMSRQEGASADSDRSKDRTPRFNYTGIIERAVDMTGTAMAGEPHAIADEFSYQLNHRMLELKRELGLMLIHGGRSAAAGSDTTHRTMGGLTWFLMQAGANYSNSAVAFSESLINDMVKEIYDDGGDPSHMIMPIGLLQALVDAQQDKIRITQSDKLAGHYVTRYLSNIGIELTIVPERYLHASELIIVDSSKLAYMPLQGRQLMAEPLGKVGDKRVWDIVGEYTCNVRNYLEAHSFRNQVTNT